jgi:hypothetical protein
MLALIGNITLIVLLKLKTKHDTHSGLDLLETWQRNRQIHIWRQSLQAPGDVIGAKCLFVVLVR